MLIVPSTTRVDLAVVQAELPQPPSYSEVRGLWEGRTEPAALCATASSVYISFTAGSS